VARKRFKPNAFKKVAQNKLMSLPKFSRTKYEGHLKPIFNINLLAKNDSPDGSEMLDSTRSGI